MRPKVVAASAKPYSMSARMVCRGSLREAVLDVGADGLQGDGALVIVLNAGDLAAAETAGAAGLDALGAGAHGAGHGVLHGAAVRDALFQLLGDVLRHQLGVHVGVLDLDDVQLHLLADELLNGQAILLDLLAALADDHAGPGAVQIDGFFRYLRIF